MYVWPLSAIYGTYGAVTNSLSFTESNGNVSQRYSFAKGGSYCEEDR